MSTAISFPFKEIGDGIFPADKTGNLNDALTPTGLTTPAIIESLLGRGREFGTSKAFQTTEVAADSTLLRRSMTFRAFMTYEIAAVADATVSILAERSDGGGTPKVMFGVELTRVSSVFMKVRLYWEDSGGPAVTAGVTFVAPTDFFQLAIVREWKNSGDVDVSYYVNESFMGSENVTDGDVVGVSGGVFDIGGSSLGGFGEYLPDGSIVDSMQIENDAMSPEEIRQEFRRVTKHQPNGYRILRAYTPPGQAWSKSPESNVQKWIASEGDALGIALADSNRLRDNFLPDRAYGKTLEAWERITGISPATNATIQNRRDKVLSFLRKTLGFPVDEIKEALEILLGLDSAQIAIYEFTGLREDDFSTEDIIAAPSPMWTTRGIDGPHTATINIGTPNCVLRKDGAEDGHWPFDVSESGEGPNREVDLGHRLGSLAEEFFCAINLDAVVEGGGDDMRDTTSGLFVRNLAGDVLLYGYDERTSDIETWTFDAGTQTQSGVTVILASPSLPQRLAIRHIGGTDYEVGTLAGSVFTILNTVTGPADPSHCGFGIFENGGSSTRSGDAHFSGFEIFELNTQRGFGFMVYRDSGLGGVYDLRGAQEQLDKQKPAHAHGFVGDDLQGLVLGANGQIGKGLLFPKIG